MSGLGDKLQEVTVWSFLGLLLQGDSLSGLGLRGLFLRLGFLVAAPVVSWGLMFFLLTAVTSGSFRNCSGFAFFSSGTDTENHRITGWKRPLRSSSPTITPAPPRLLNPVPKCHIHTVFEPLQGWGLPHCPGQPAPTPHCSFREEIFPNIQSEPPLMQLEATASHPIAG